MAEAAPQQQGVPVRRRPGDKFAGQIAACTWPVVRHDRLTQYLAHLVPDGPADEVTTAPGRKAHDQLDGLVGEVTLCPDTDRQGQGETGPCCQVKSATLHHCLQCSV